MSDNEVLLQLVRERMSCTVNTLAPLYTRLEMIEKSLEAKVKEEAEWAKEERRKR